METSKIKKRAHTLFSVLIMVIGFGLMILKITLDSEPGAIPLLIIIIGAGWFGLTWFKRSGKA